MTIKFDIPNASVVALAATLGAVTINETSPDWGNSPTSGSALVGVTKHNDGAVAPAVVGIELAMSGFTKPDRELSYIIDWGVEGSSFATDAAPIAKTLYTGTDGMRYTHQDIGCHLYETAGEKTVSISVSDGTNTTNVTATFDLAARSVLAANTIYVDPAGTVDVQHSWAPSGARYATTLAEAKADYDDLSGDTAIVFKDDAVWNEKFPSAFTGNRNLWLERSGDGTARSRIIGTNGNTIEIGIPEGYCAHIDGLEIEGQWDAQTETGNQTDGIRLREDTGDLLVKDCFIHKNFHNLYINTSSGAQWQAVVRTRLHASGNYAALWPNPTHGIILGCSMTADPLSYAGGGGKGNGFNEHGSAMRMSAPRSRDTSWQYFAYNDSFNMMTWTGNVVNDKASSQPGYRYNFSGLSGVRMRAEGLYHEGSTAMNIGNTGGGAGIGRPSGDIWVHGVTAVQTAQGEGQTINATSLGLYLTACATVRPNISANVSYGSPLGITGEDYPVETRDLPVRLLNNTIIQNDPGDDPGGNISMVRFTQDLTGSGPNGNMSDFLEANNVVYTKSSKWASEIAALGPVTELTYADLGITPYYQSYQDSQRTTPDTSVAIPTSTIIRIVPGATSSLATLESGAPFAALDMNGSPHNAQGAVMFVA